MAQTPVHTDAGFPLLLIVDSDETARRAVAQVLERLRWTVVHAGDAESAIELCAGHPFDVILLDASMESGAFEKTVRSIRYGSVENQSATIIAYGDPDQPPLTDLSADRDVDLHVEKPLNNTLLPVYIAQASTRRLEAHSRFRKASNLCN